MGSNWYFLVFFEYDLDWTNLTEKQKKNIRYIGHEPNTSISTNETGSDGTYLTESISLQKHSFITAATYYLCTSMYNTTTYVSATTSLWQYTFVFSFFITLCTVLLLSWYIFIVSGNLCERKLQKAKKWLWVCYKERHIL